MSLGTRDSLGGGGGGGDKSKCSAQSEEHTLFGIDSADYLAAFLSGAPAITASAGYVEQGTQPVTP